MTETQLRQKLVDMAISYLGCKESNNSHRPIIDIYNSLNPLPVGYKVKYTDAWCATYVTAMAIKVGMTDIIPPECGCDRMIKLFKSHPISTWQEDESVIPRPGDIIFYDWDDNGIGDNLGYSDHVGIVVSVTGDTMKIIEGNMDDSVGYRNLKVNATRIRGYGFPNYASKATEADAPTTPTTTGDEDDVEFIKVRCTTKTIPFDENGKLEPSRYIAVNDICTIRDKLTPSLLVEIEYPISSGTRVAYIKNLSGFVKV